MKRIFTPLASEFQFAGFKFPKYVWTLPPRSLAKRKERHSDSRCTGDYYHAPKPDHAGKGSGFYVNSDGAPGLRWKYCDKVDGAHVEHTGWFTDEYGDAEKIRGIVFRLPKSRGFLAGWTMGEGMASEIDCTSIYEDEMTAAHAADSMAEDVAEDQREHEEKERARMNDEEMESLNLALCAE